MNELYFLGIMTEGTNEGAIIKIAFPTIGIINVIEQLFILLKIGMNLDLWLFIKTLEK